MSGCTRRMPTERAVRAYWVEALWHRKGFDSPEEFLERGTCFACGDERAVERAHILARCSGGSDDASNIHILCRICHKDSETLDGEAYWSWFWQRSLMDAVLSHACKLGFNLHSELLTHEAARKRQEVEA
jgi:5-methylcytosine-specific restriction endonuclease McrA